MWVTKLLIFPVEISIFCPKTTKFGPKLAILVNLGQAMQAYSMPCCGSVGGCGARAVSRKTPIYFMIVIIMILISERPPQATTCTHSPHIHGGSLLSQRSLSIMICNDIFESNIHENNNNACVFIK